MLFRSWITATKSDQVAGIVSYEPGNVIFPEGELPPPIRRNDGTMIPAGRTVPLEEFRKLTNMPIQRFGSMLISKGLFEQYLDLLKSAYRPENLESVMCRDLVSVDWRGYLYDCDFNQMLGLPLKWRGRPAVHLRDLVGGDLANNPITVKDHCYGCTAGQGSSCGGALA